jgi:quercetin dioxygenase-like cupin family protein
MVEELHVVHIGDVKPISPLGPGMSLTHLIDKKFTEGKLGLGVCMVDSGAKTNKWKQSHAEIHYITSGELEFHFGEEKMNLKTGDAVYLPESDVDCYWVNKGKKTATVIYASTYV